MLYWVMWLILGLGVSLTLSFMSLLAFKSVQSGAKNFGGVLARLAFFVLCVSLDVMVFCWTMDAFVTQSKAGFPYAYVSDGNFHWWFVCLAVGLAATGFVVGAILCKYKFTLVRASVEASERRAVNKDRLFWIVQLAVLCVGAILGATILTLLLDYVLLHEVSLEAAKRLILLGVGVELFASAVICGILWKSVWKHRRTILPVVSAALLSVFVLSYVLLALGSKDAVERIMFVVGTGTFVLIPIVYFVALLMWFGLRRRNLQNFENNFNK